MSSALPSGNIFANFYTETENPPSATKGYGSFILRIPINIEINPSPKQTFIAPSLQGGLYLDSQFITNISLHEGDIRLQTFPENIKRTSHQLKFILWNFLCGPSFQYKICQLMV